MVSYWYPLGSHKISLSHPICYSFDPKAEETCEALLKTAFETEPDNIEALISLSSFRLSQQRTNEAREAAMKAWFSWKDIIDEGLIFFCLRFFSIFDQYS